MTRFTRPTIMLGALGAATALTLSACGSSGPPSALSIVKSDGYTTGAATVSQAQISADMESFQGDVSSGAAGFNTNDNVEVVIVLTDSGTTDINSEGGQSALQASVPSGVTATMNGDVIRMTGSIASFTGLN
jgi:hypothetical protein